MTPGDNPAWLGDSPVFVTYPDVLADYETGFAIPIATASDAQSDGGTDCGQYEHEFTVSFFTESESFNVDTVGDSDCCSAWISIDLDNGELAID